MDSGTLPTAVLDVLAPTSQRQVLDQRGSVVWDAESERGRYAVKVGHPIIASALRAGQPWTAKAPAREGVILNQLRDDLTPYGEWEHGT